MKSMTLFLILFSSTSAMAASQRVGCTTPLTQSTAKTDYTIIVDTRPGYGSQATLKIKEPGSLRTETKFQVLKRVGTPRKPSFFTMTLEAFNSPLMARAKKQRRSRQAKMSLSHTYMSNTKE